MNSTGLTPASTSIARWGALLVLVAATLVASGCGGDDATTEPETDTTPIEEPAPSEWWGVWATTTSRPTDLPRGAAGGVLVDTVSICEQFDTALWLDRFIAEVTREVLPIGCSLEAQSVCNVDWSLTTVDYDCDFEGTMTCPGGSCDATWNVSGNGTRSGNAMSLVHTIQVSQSGPGACQADTTVTLVTSGTRIEAEPNLALCPGAPDTTTTPNGVFCTINTGTQQVEFNARDKSVVAQWNETAGYRVSAFYSEAIIGAGIRHYELVFVVPPQDDLPVTIPVTTQQEEGTAYVLYEESTEDLDSTLIGSGSIRVVEARPNRLVASFQFAGDLDGNIPGTRSISDGQLDVGTISPR